MPTRSRETDHEVADGPGFSAPARQSVQGLRAAVWLFAAIVILKLIIGTNSALNTRAVAVGADGIPLDSMGEASAHIVMSLFAAVGLGQALLGLLGLLVLIRYRTMIPIMFLLFLTDHLARKALATSRAVAETATPSVGYYINLAILALLVAGFILSAMKRGDRRAIAA